MSTPSRPDEADRIAAEHWITNHNGPRCVACGWWEPRNGEDTTHAARRHVAEVALAAVDTSYRMGGRLLLFPGSIEVSELQAITLRGLTSNWRPGSHDTADGPDGANTAWTWEHEAYDLLVETRPYYQAGVLARVHNEGIGFADEYAPITLGNDGRVWDGHHRIVAAMALGVAVLSVDIVPPIGLTTDAEQ